MGKEHDGCCICDSLLTLVFTHLSSKPHSVLTILTRLTQKLFPVRFGKFFENVDKCVSELIVHFLGHKSRSMNMCSLFLWYSRFHGKFVYTLRHRYDRCR